jgi:SOS-response transcriptional repressor LexA
MTRGNIAFFVQHRENRGMSRNNLQQWRNQIGMDRKDLAKKLGISLASISRIESGKQQPREDLIDPILKIFKKKRSEFYEDAPIVSNVLPTDEGAVKVPLIDYNQAVLFTGRVVPDLLRHGIEDFILTDGDHSRMAFALEVKGDSMIPSFKEGDKIIVDRDVTPGPGDYVIASEKGGEVTFRKYRPVGKSETGKEVFELIPLNDDYATVRSDVVDVEVIGTMIEYRIKRKRSI